MGALTFSRIDKSEEIIIEEKHRWSVPRRSDIPFRTLDAFLNAVPTSSQHGAVFERERNQEYVVFARTNYATGGAVENIGFHCVPGNHYMLAEPEFYVKTLKEPRTRKEARVRCPECRNDFGLLSEQQPYKS